MSSVVGKRWQIPAHQGRSCRFDATVLRNDRTVPDLRAGAKIVATVTDRLGNAVVTKRNVAAGGGDSEVSVGSTEQTKNIVTVTLITPDEWTSNVALAALAPGYYDLAVDVEEPGNFESPALEGSLRIRRGARPSQL